MRRYIDEYLDTDAKLIETIVIDNYAKGEHVDRIVEILIDELYLFDDEDDVERYKKEVESIIKNI